MKKLLLLLCICLLATACQQSKNQIIIEGSLQNAGHEKIILAIITPEGLSRVDSTTLRDGKFRFVIKARTEAEQQQASSPMMYQLILSPNNTLTTLAQGGDHIILNANAEKLIRNYQISGGEEAELVRQLDSALNSFVEAADQLFIYYQANIFNDSIKNEIEQQYNPLVQKHKEFLTDFIEHHPDKMASLIAFYQNYNRRYFFDEMEDFDLLNNITNSLQKKYPDNPYILQMKQHVEMLDFRIKKTSTI